MLLSNLEDNSILKVLKVKTEIDLNLINDNIVQIVNILLTNLTPNRSKTVRQDTIFSRKINLCKQTIREK